MDSKLIAIGTPVTLTVPAAKEMMLVIRLTTAAVMARAGISADGMDDMKMAVEEAATCLMQTACLESIQLSFQRKPEGCLVQLLGTSKKDQSGCTQRQAADLSEDEIAVVRCILETMADEVTLTEENNHIRSISLMKWNDCTVHTA